MHGLTDTETRLVEDYLWVIDLISRCAQGLDGGDWYYLADKAQDLARRAARLADTAAQIAQAIRDDRPGPRPRTEAIVRLGATSITGRSTALRALADALVEAAELADAYDADPDAFDERERAQRDLDLDH